MTVQTTTHRNDYTGNGTTVDFAVTFYFLDETHLDVYKTTIADGTTVLLALTTDYTVTGAGVSTGGTVTLNVAPTADYKISILRNVPYTQLTHYVENDPFPATAHEDALDKLTMEVQQLDERIDRSIKISPTNTINSLEITTPAAERANKVLAFDGSGELSVTQEIGTYRGLWVSGYTYRVRDLVQDGSNLNIYICNTGHTSTGSTPLGTNPGNAYWTLIVDAASATTAASAASASASAASASASAASTSANNASTSASNASSNYTSFHNAYYGPLAADPTTRPDASAMSAGDLYYNTGSAAMKAYSGSAWVTAYVPSSGGALQAGLNLSDLTNVATARTNLGLGTAATVNTGGTANLIPKLDGSGRLGFGTSATANVTLAVNGTDAALIPVGTTAQRPTGATGYIRYNTTVGTFEGHNGTAWGSIGGGAAGGGSDKIFYENDTTITTSYTITTNKNAVSAGPITINSGATVTVPSGSTWVVV